MGRQKMKRLGTESGKNFFPNKHTNSMMFEEEMGLHLELQIRKDKDSRFLLPGGEKK